MEEKDRKGFRTVAGTDEKEYKQKIREHRLKVMKKVTIVVLILFVVGAGLGVFMAFRHYEGFDVLASVDRSDTEGTQFEVFAGNILKYSNDGAFYLDAQNGLIWNQTYEMAMPQIDICGDYLTIYDKRGSRIYIFTKDGLKGSIETTLPITQVCVAAQGTVAALMQKDDAGYLALYDREGNNLAQGAIHGEKGGYPIAIALSHDAIKLAVSMLDVNDGQVKSTLAFYNFGSVGQNEIDNCVGVISFSDMVIPEIEFMTNDRMSAFGSSKIMIFEGKQKPELKAEIPIDREAKSVFCNEDYIGFIIPGDGEIVTHYMLVYDTNGKQTMGKDIGSEYGKAEFLSNNEICLRNGSVCDIYTIRGVYKFHYEFDSEIYKVLPGISRLNYTFVLKNVTEKVRLK
ncbi:MAG: DUF5711 family protein [Clostridiales bacterium]|nr:DUF5711 family protein [Clostridiales bacterium]